MTNLDLTELKRLVEIYVRTLNNEDKYEWYTTHRGNATGQLERFVKWIERDGRTRNEEARRDASESPAALLRAWCYHEGYAGPPETCPKHGAAERGTGG